jgi:soluble lytic murein transglycosylase-like protein
VTTGLFATHSLAFGHELHLELGRTRAIILALLATLCIALVARSAVPADRPLTEPVAAASNGQPQVPASIQAMPTAARARSEIEVLSRLVAKRYRISTESTRGLVGSAYREGQRVGLDPLLIVAVIAVESSFNPIAESDAGAQGLMQVIPSYHKEQMQAAGIDSALDPHDNIRLGAQILKDYIRRGGSEVAGLQIYSGAAADTSNAYALRVLAEKQRLQQAIQRLHA